MNKRRLILWLTCGTLALILASPALFTSSAQKPKQGLGSLPPELDVRVKGSVLSGRLPDGARTQTQSAPAAELVQANAAQWSEGPACPSGLVV